MRNDARCDSGAQGGRTAQAPVSRLWSLCEDVLVEYEPDRLVVVSRWGEIVVERPSSTVRRLLTRMSMGPVSMDNVLCTDAAQDATGERQPADLAHVLNLISGSVENTLSLVHGGPLLSVIPATADARFVPWQVTGTTWLRLSRFAVIRPVNGCLQAESPLANHRVVVYPIVSSLVAALATPRRSSELTTTGLPAAAVAEVVSYLVAAGVAVESHSGTSDAVFAEDTDPGLAAWSHHDLFFHRQSRMGRHSCTPETAVRPVQRVPATPAPRPLPSGPRFALPRPAEPWTGGATLAELLAEPAAVTTEFDSEGLTVTELGTLLFRATRVGTVPQSSMSTDPAHAVSEWPYPTVSGLHEFEIYLSVDRSDGLPSGIYHYDPAEHGLTPVNTSPQALDRVFDTVRAATGLRSTPPLVISMATRPGQRSWGYQGLAYAATLMHLGLVHQTLRLVTHSMGLVTRLLTTDGGDVIDRALCLESRTETTVGDLVLGRPRQSAGGARRPPN